MVQAWKDLNGRRNHYGPSSSPCGGWRTGDPQAAPLLPCGWGETPWTWPSGSLSLPPGKNGAAAGFLGGPAGPPSALCHWEGASPAYISPKYQLHQSVLGILQELKEVEGRNKMEEVRDGEEDLGSSFICLYS